jgi:biotin operon repressor
MLDALIRKRSTGNQKEFSRKTCMSRSLLNNYINEMKELGFPIEYDKKRGTYYYKEEGRLVSKLFQAKLDEDDMKQYKGGCSDFAAILNAIYK